MEEETTESSKRTPLNTVHKYDTMPSKRRPQSRALALAGSTKDCQRYLRNSIWIRTENTSHNKEDFLPSQHCWAGDGHDGYNGISHEIDGFRDSGEFSKAILQS